MGDAVDDHPVVRDGMKALVGAAFAGETAVREVTELRPDVVVMDLSMPGMGGTEATRRIREGCPEVRVVALTAYEERGYLRQVVAAGGSGYVLKRSAAADLAEAIRHAAAGDTYLDPAVARQAERRSDPAGEAAAAPQLGGREEEVLRQVARGYSNKQIAARLGVSVKTVEVDKSRAMGKLGRGPASTSSGTPPGAGG